MARLQRHIDADHLSFLLEAEADLADWLAAGALSAQAEDRPAYRTNYIGSKQKLLDFIWEATPAGVARAVDAFSGSSAVGYMYKGRGLGVATNDRLRYAFHIARAIVENNDVTLSDVEIAALVAPNPNAGTFVRDTFAGIYFPEGVHEVIDEVRANIEPLSGYKRDIALFAIGKACIGGKASFGHFGTSVTNERGDTPDEFRARVQNEARRINALVFAGERPCTAANQDILDFLPSVEADLAYFDPPYATEFSQTNYERAYHFIEGLMTYWDGKEIEANSKLKTYKIESKGITRKTARDFFTRFLGAADHVPNWLLSYRDKAYPSEAEIQELVAAAGKACEMQSRDHAYSISAKRSENSQAKEHLFICSPADGADASVRGDATCPRCRAAAAGKLSTRAAAALLEVDADEDQPRAEGDKTFRFVLTHAGTNKNGDHFTPEELKTAAATAVGRKIDLAHSQEFRDIVEAIVSAEYLDDGGAPRAECVGELYTAESESARLAYKLMKRGVVAHVSMECDYDAGEFSICGKSIKSRAEYCVHLKNSKGADHRGKPVFEILHGVTFTGVGLLDREGADEGAVISNVAKPHVATPLVAMPHGAAPKLEATEALRAAAEHNSKGAQTMPDDKKPESPAGAGAAGAQPPITRDPGGNPPGGSPPGGAPDPAAELQRLRDENDRLKREPAAAKQQIEALQAEKAAQARRTRAEKLVDAWEQKGMTFADTKARDVELDRLAALSDEALSASEAVIASLPAVPVAPASADGADKPGAADDKPTAAEGAKPNAQAAQRGRQVPVDGRAPAHGRAPAPDAGVKPFAVDDARLSLEDKLKHGLMAAYKGRNARSQHQPQ